jgi:metallophosphoesterase (TIGR00282 family)
MIGDVVGKPGMRIACAAAAWLRNRLKAEFLVINAENAADGTGLRNSEFDRLIQAGYDVVTLGDHVYRKKEIIDRLHNSDRLVRPLNFPESAQGKGWTVVSSKRGIQVCVVSLMGRVFMRPVDCPFTAILDLLKNENLPPVRLIDFHAEATSDKQALGWLLDGKISAVCGTHTHVTTADEQILPNGTGYQTDLGMSGPFKSVLGRDIEAVLKATISFEPVAFHVATQDVRLSGTYVDLDTATGMCRHIERIQWTESLISKWESERKDLLTKL